MIVFPLLPPRADWREALDLKAEIGGQYYHDE